MSNFNINPLQVAVPGNGPIRFNASTTDSYDVITLPGYMDDQITTVGIKNNDVVEITYDWNTANGFSVYNEFLVTVSNGVSTLIPTIFLNNLTPSGLLTTWLSNTTVQVAGGKTADSSDTFLINLPAPVVVNFATVGANGLDTGSIAANKPYYIYVIADRTGVNTGAAIASLNRTAPALPSGYTNYEQVFGLCTDGSSHLRPFICSGQLASGIYVQYLTAFAVLSGGTSTSFVGIDLTTPVAAVPASANVEISLGAQATAGNPILGIRDTGNTAASSVAACPYQFGGAAGTIVSGSRFSPGINGSNNPSIDYAVTTGTVNVTVNGYVYNASLA